MTTAWMREAACRDMPSELFFPLSGHHEQVAVAKEVCAGCAVREECLAFALAHNEHHGIWGGVTERERRGLRRGRVA